MHLSKLSLVNYRNFANTKVLFNKGTNTIIGENGSGKTNLFRAIRLLLDDSMLRAAYRLDETDFHRGLQRWQGHWIIISLEFEEISTDEAIQALFVHGTGVIDDKPVAKATYNLFFRPKKEIRLSLSQVAARDHAAMNAILTAITVGDYEAVFYGKSDADFNDPAVYKDIVGDFDTATFNVETEIPTIGTKIPGVLSVSKEISFTYVQALRDVVAEFHNNRTNPLLTLLKSKSGDIDPALFAPITAKVKELNDSIEELPDVQIVRGDIRETIKDAAGEAYSPSSLSIKSDLPNEADKLFQSLRLFVGEAGEPYEGPIHELSLGGANLIFLTLKLLEFKYQKEKTTFANFLLIEEPEAHIHTHIQKTLFDKLKYDDTQIIYSTHSTHISEVSNVRNMNILGRSSNRCDAYQPATGLSPSEVDNIQRYLDAVRSNLLFAKSVLLVEGDAEEILIPVMIKQVFGVSLDELGISLINIRSTGFQNVAVLFHNDRIRKKCSIVTDLDKAIIDTAHVAGESDAVRKYKTKCAGSESAGITRKDTLDTFIDGNSWLATYFATHTFEVDFVAAGNSDKVIASINDVYKDPATIVKAKEDLESGDLTRYGRRVLTMAENQGKGWFAILLSQKINHQTVIPTYIIDAIAFAHPVIDSAVWFNVLSYRLRHIAASDAYPAATVDAFRVKLNEFSSGTLDFADIRTEMLTTFTDDRINAILERF